MRVYEVAKEFNVPAESLIQLLREMGVSVRSEASQVEDAVVARLRARFERERRAGLTNAEEVIEAVMEDALAGTRRRRRRRREEGAPEVTAADSSASATADAAEQLAAERAEEA